MRFTCNLAAQKCDLGRVLENCRDGDELVLQVPDSQAWLAESMAKTLRAHLGTARRAVAIKIQTLPPPPPARS